MKETTMPTQETSKVVVIKTTAPTPETKPAKQNSEEKNRYAITLDVEANTKLDNILKTCNEGHRGTKISANSVVNYFLKNYSLKPKEIKEIQENAMTAADLINLQYELFLTQHPNVSKDDFILWSIGKKMKSLPN